MAQFYLRDLKNTIDRQLPAWASARLVPRGLSLPIDLFLKGRARFAKKIGQAYPVLLPNNTTKLAVQARELEFVLRLHTNSLDYVAPGYLIDIAGQHINRVAAVLPDGGWWLDFRLPKGFDSGTEVYVLGAPGKHNGARLAGATDLEMEFPAHMPLMVGDTIMQEGDITLTFYNYKVVEVLQNPSPGHTTTAFRIDAPLRRSVADGGVLYLKANPAYFSQLITIPQGYPSLPVDFGPFLLDRVTGLISENPDPSSDGAVPERLEVELYSTGPTLHRTLVALNERARTPCQVWNAPISSQHMALWDIKHGALDVSSSDVIATLDFRGRFGLLTTLAPAMNSIGEEELPEWRVHATSDAPFFFSLSAWPGVAEGADSYSSHGQQLVALKLDMGALAVDDKPSLLELTVRGTPGQRVVISTSLSGLPSIRALRYRLLAETRGEYHWASSGFFLNPLFLSIEYLTAMGREIPLNSGKMTL